MKWFKEVFLPSFEDCQGKRISEKQGMIFEKYLDPENYSHDNAEYFSKIVNGRKIKLQKSATFNGCYYDKRGRHTKYRDEYFLTIESNL
jgi:hypothetical protein